MNEQDKYDEELLKKLINPGRIEKAPEGFTSRTIARIRIDTQSSLKKEGFFIRNRVPLISAAVIAAFIIAAVTIPANDAGSFGSLLWNYVSKLNISLPIKSDSFFSDFSLPGWTKYTAILLFMLLFFDRALFRLFHKENN